MSVDLRGQHDDGGGVYRGESAKPRRVASMRASGRRAARRRPKLDAEPGPMRLVDGARLEDALDEAIGDIGRAGFCEAADQSEQDRASGKSGHCDHGNPANRAAGQPHVARCERDLGLGNLAARLGESLFGAEAAHGAPRSSRARL